MQPPAQPLGENGLVRAAPAYIDLPSTPPRPPLDLPSISASSQVLEGVPVLRVEMQYSGEWDERH